MVSVLLPREIYVELATVSIISDKKDSLVFVFISSYISFNIIKTLISSNAVRTSLSVN